MKTSTNNCACSNSLRDAWLEDHAKVVSPLAVALHARVALKRVFGFPLASRLCWGGGGSCVGHRAQLGRVDGSRRIWVLQIKFPCHTNLRLSIQP